MARVRMTTGWKTQLNAAGLDRTLGHLTDDIADDARDTVRSGSYDTGALYRGIGSEAHDGEGRVTVNRDGQPGDSEDIWSFVEFGTVNMDAEPYLRPALYQRRSLR